MTRLASAETWLVTGGAGYIGAHVVRDLHRRGVATVVLDDLSTGLLSRVVGPAVIGSVHDTALLTDVLTRYRCTGVIHIAGSKSVAESVVDPDRYYANNVVGLQRLLCAMREAGVGRIVFSSTAAVYGPVDAGPVTESAVAAPVSPYGRSKLVGEWMLADCARAYGLRYAALRYFNVAGSASQVLCEVGGVNLVPQVLQAIGQGRPPVIFGDDHATPDGTCVRDFIDVRDLAAAHASVLGLLAVPGAAHVFNVGTGRGYSVREVVDQALAATGSRLRPVVQPPRDGDPGSVVADAARLTRATAWRASYGLDQMIRSVVPRQRRALPH